MRTQGNAADAEGGVSRDSARSVSAARPVLVVDSPASLVALRRYQPVRATPTVVAAFAGFSAADNERLTRQWTRWLAECGCAQGTAAFLIYLTLLIALAWQDRWPVAEWSWSRGMILLGGAVAVVGVTKSIAKALARQRLHRSIDSVLKRWQTPPLLPS
jgi:hypothetical protein